MRVLSLASQKGGSGKTTLSGHIGVQADLAGFGPVALIDTDPQGSLAAWWNERRAETPHFVQTSIDRLEEDLESLRRAGVELVVIDTPPAITTAIQQVIGVSDLVVVPTRPSPHDLRAVGATLKLVEKCRKPLIFVVNAATPRARITSEAAIALSQYGTVAPVTIHQRTDFASCMIDGRTVMESKAPGRSAVEIEALWAYVQARLDHGIPPSVFHIHEHPAFPGTAPAAAVPRSGEDDDTPPLKAPRLDPAELDPGRDALDEALAERRAAHAFGVVATPAASAPAQAAAAPPPPRPAPRRLFGFGRRRVE